MKLLLDSGGLIALERGDRVVWTALREAERLDRPILTHAGVIGQVWRSGGPRQARLTRALAAVRVIALDERLGRAAGRLLHVARTRDVIDAALVLLAYDGDEILTSDPKDIALLARVARLDVDIIEV